MKTRVGIAVLLVICAIDLLWLIKDKNEKKVNIQEAPPVVEPTKSSTSISQQTPSPDKPIFQIKAECKPTNISYTKAEYKWKEQLNEYIYSKSSEYNTDLVLQAIMLTERFQFLSYQVYLHIKNYRKSEEARNLDSHRGTIRQKRDSEYFSRNRINWSHIESLSEESRTRFLEEYRPDVESVVELILNNGSDSLIASTFSNIPYLSRSAWGDSHQKGSSIFDALILADKTSLLEAYFAAGGKLEHSTFGVNSLEKLLLYVPFDELKDKKQAIKSAVDLGLTVRYEALNENLINIGQFHTMHMQFKESDFAKYQKLGFRFELAKTLESLGNDPYVLDMEAKLNDAKLEFIKQEIDGFNLEKFSNCKSVEKQARELVHNNNYEKQLAEIFEYNKNDLSKLREDFYAIEPGLNDCFSHPKLNPNKEKLDSYIDRNKLFELVDMFRKGDPFEAVEVAKASNMSHWDKSQLFWEVADFMPDHARLLLDHGFYPFQTIGSNTAKMTPEIFALLQEHGFDFNVSNGKERTLVEVAASKCNFELIDALYKAGYDYQTDDKRADALSIAIRYNNCFPYNRTTPKKIELIKSTLQFEPEIKEYHKKRMSELRLSDIEVYNKVVDSFPQLAVGDSIKPTGAICSQIRFPNGDLANLPLHF